MKGFYEVQGRLQKDTQPVLIEQAVSQWRRRLSWTKTTETTPADALKKSRGDNCAFNGVTVRYASATGGSILDNLGT